MNIDKATAVSVLYCTLAYAAVVIANTLAMSKGVYDYRTGDFVFKTLQLATFIMAATALFKK